MLPGHGRPLNYIPEKGDPDYVGNLFRNALSFRDLSNERIGLRLITLREIAMLQFMNIITDKPDWAVKINDSHITGKWIKEALASNLDMTSKMIDWCLDELRFKATLVLSSQVAAPPIVVYNGDVVKSDTALSVNFKQELQNAIAVFEKNIPDHLKVWHPGSDEKVWDLVHPSLFPLVYGRTRVLEHGIITTLQDCMERCGEGITTKIPPEQESEEQTRERGAYSDSDGKKIYSRKYQWLPCEVDISTNKARITSYINNLHPSRELLIYGLIERLIEESIPLWNLTLAPLQDDHSHSLRINYDSVLYDPDPANGPMKDGPQRDEGESYNDYYHRREQWYEETRKVVLPDITAAFSLDALPRPPPAYSLKDKFGSRGLQIIVKLANIELTPEKPKYDGGTWHVEGQMNEHIVATSLYYYSCSNITDSFLSFRQSFAYDETSEISYPQSVHDWFPLVFGCEQDEPAVQEVGSIKTSEGRLVTFPNILHHRVGPFELVDPSKPGHRKIIALFLVDPNIKIISTAHVPCQRQDWWWDAGQSISTSQGRAMAEGTIELPREIEDHILASVDFPMSLKDAKTNRDELMEERSAFALHQSRHHDRVFTVSLCEH